MFSDQNRMLSKFSLCRRLPFTKKYGGSANQDSEESTADVGSGVLVSDAERTGISDLMNEFSSERLASYLQLVRISLHQDPPFASH